MKEIFDIQQPTISYCDLKQVYVRVNEEEIQVEEYNNPMEEGGEPTLVTKYQYDVVLTTVDYPTEEHVVAKMKELKNNDIMAYDSSSEVNSFTFRGVEMWLDKDTRNGLVMRLNAEKEAGHITTTLWLGTQSFTLGVDEGLQLLAALELYASACFDNTSSHLAAVEQLDDVEDIFNYDYKTGYPEKLIINDIEELSK